MKTVTLISPTGVPREIPLSNTHEPVEAWLKRGWTYPKAAAPPAAAATATPTPPASTSAAAKEPPAPAA